MAGFHNDNLEVSTSRIIEGCSWKKTDTIILIPAGKTMSTKVALSWLNLMSPPNQNIHRMLICDMEVGEAYSLAMQEILAHDQLQAWKYILTLEHDNVPPPDGLVKLIAQMEKHPEFSAIGGLYFHKGENATAHIWGDINDPVLNFRPQPPRAGELVECNGCSMGFTLFRLDMFKDKRFEQPIFKTCGGLSNDGLMTQDLFFAATAKKLGYRFAVDCSILVGHHDLGANFTW